MILPELPTELLWRNALALMPVAILVAAACRWLPCRPSTRHTMWLTVLLLLIVLPVIPARLDPTAARVTATPILAPVATPSPATRTRHESLATTASPPKADEIDGVPMVAGANPSPDAAEPPIRRPRPPVSASSVDQTRPVVGRASPVLIEKSEEPSIVLAEPAPGATPLEPTATSNSSQAPGVFLTEARRWLTRLGDVRDAVMALPPVPTSIWTGGVMLLLACLLVRRRRSHALLRRATAAPAMVRRMVTEASMQMDIARVPEVLMTDDRLSPMVWCGRRPRLVLPWPLWRHLDDLGRRAVVLHELAHLRRRDHWVCWAELLVGVVYWWHPVVWWVRRRLREEADLSCDAWVTTLLPTARRSYAQALLETRKYVSANHAAPAIGLGSGTIRAKRFARRLTMVMTEHSAPRLSLRGVIMTATLATAACVAVPVLACPPKDKAPEPPARPLTLRLTAPTPEAMTPLGRPETDASAETTFERFMRTRQDDGRDRGGDEGEVEDRIRQLERQLERMQDLLERYLEDGVPRDRVPGPATRPDRDRPDAPDAMVAPSLPRAARLPSGPSAPSAARAPRAPRAARAPGAVRAPRAPAAARAPIASLAVPRVSAAPGAAARAMTVGPDAGSDCAAVRARKHELEEGKLADLVELMVRQDVPVLVAPMDDAIELHGNLAQQTAFGAFVKMIGSDRVRVVRYDLSQGKLELLQKLMRRADVPVIVELASDHIKVHGNDLEQMVFASFVDLIEPGRGTREDAAAGVGRGARYFEQAAEAYDEAAAEPRTRPRRDATRRGRTDARRFQMEAKLAELEALHASAEAQMAAFEAQAEMFESQAGDIEDQIEELEDHADELNEQADELEGEARRGLQAEIRAVREQSRQLMQLARQLERRAQQMEREMEQLERQSDRIEEEADKIRDRIEELEEEAENDRDSEGAR